MVTLNLNTNQLSITAFSIA